MPLAPIFPLSGVQFILVEHGTMFADEHGKVIVVTDTTAAIKDGVWRVTQAMWDAICKAVPSVDKAAA